MQNNEKSDFFIGANLPWTILNVLLPLNALTGIGIIIIIMPDFFFLDDVIIM